MEKANEPERAPELSGLVESALFVENLAFACGFYEQVLSLSKIELSEKGCVLRVADQRYLLLVTDEGARRSSETPYGIVPPCAVAQRDTAGPGHIAFGIPADAVDSWRERLEKHGIKILSEITWQHGARSMYFRDPDGHLIGLATAGIWEPV